MSETTNLKLKKHDNVETNTNQFDIENYINGNFDKIDDFAGEIKQDLEDRVLKVEGKGLSTEDFTTEKKQKLEDLENYDDTGIKEDISKNTADIENLEQNKANKTDMETLQAELLETQETLLETQEECKRLQKDIGAGTMSGEGTGESLYLQDSSDARFREFRISGNSRQEAEPSFESPSPVECSGENGDINATICNKNILPIQISDSQTTNGVTISNDNGRLTINGEATASFQLNIAENFYIPKNNSIFKANEISGSMANPGEGIYCAYSIRNADNVQLISGLANRVGTNSEKTIEADLLGNVAKFFALWINKDTVFNNFIIEPQLETGNVATDYVAHEEQTVTMPVQQEMLEEDYLDLDNEEEVHHYEKIVLDGTENWNTGGAPAQVNTLYATIQYANPDLQSTIINLKSNSLEAVSANKLWATDSEAIAQSRTQIAIRIDRSKASTIAELKQYLSNNNVIVFVKKATPTRLPFTEEQKIARKEIKNKLHSYKGGTLVYSTDKVSPIFNVKYTKDTEDYIKNEINKMQAMILATE